ncbi:MAG: porin [Rugosibacter sp.]|nr:porin [Rugosibacter sp.]
MKNFRLFLALAGCFGMPGIAHAQSNVTVYGNADASFDVITVHGQPTAPTLRFQRISTNGSVLGFKGAEALGSDLKAVFQFESNVSFDAGGSIGTSRSSFVGLSGDLGRVILGRFAGPARLLAITLDVNYTNDSIGSGNALMGKLGGALASNPGVRSAVTSSRFDVNTPNAIAYTSPIVAGLQATVLYSANEKKSAVPGARVNTSSTALGLNYAHGPLWIGSVFERVTEKNELAVPGLAGVGANEALTEARLGGMIDFGNATVRLLIGQTRAAGSLGDAKQLVWGLGGTFNVSANGKITGQRYHAGDISGSSLGVPGSRFSSGADTGATLYSLGYEHNLSKHTLLKANVAYLKNDAKTATHGGDGYDFGKTAAGFAGDGLVLSGMQLGMRYNF